MRTTIWLLASAVIIAALVTAIAAYLNLRSQRAMGPERTHVVLIGASIGQAWRLADWPRRVQASGFTADSVAEWRFDKSESVAEVLARPAQRFRLTRTYVRSLFRPLPRPDIVILKECSSYFPGDLRAYKQSMQNWVQQLRACNVQVVLATVVPVTRVRATRDLGKQNTLLEYNRWLRQYAQDQGISLIDLEAALRGDEEGSYLRDEFAAPDGSHLNARAYAVLDRTLLTVLCRMTPRGASPSRGSAHRGQGISP